MEDEAPEGEDGDKPKEVYRPGVHEMAADEKLDYDSTCVRVHYSAITNQAHVLFIGLRQRVPDAAQDGSDVAVSELRSVH